MIAGPLRDWGNSVLPTASRPSAGGTGANNAPLALGQIRYLVFEGGGGKGFAFLGALQVLERMDVLQFASRQHGRAGLLVGNIAGVAGASAGAITAMLVSIGYSSAEILDFMSNTDFDSFFDPPGSTPAERLRPFAGGRYEGIPQSTVEQAVELALALLPVPTDLLLNLVTSIFGLSGLRAKFDELAKKPPVLFFAQDWRKYLAHLGRDMGLFHGQGARDLFEHVLKERISRVDTPRLWAEFEHVTFKLHYHVFRVKLVVTASNLATGETQLFSKDHTPDFPVADAVRISMGLPYIYKPYVLSSDDWRGRPPCGTYVDGGLWNNLPYREFDGDPLPPPRLDPRPARPPPKNPVPNDRRKTLGIRLEIAPPSPITTFGQLLKRMVTDYAVFGTGETQVLADFASQAIILDTEGLSLFDFHPPAETRDPVIKRARRKTRLYFGLPIPDADVDNADDDKRLEELMAAVKACTAPSEPT